MQGPLRWTDHFSKRYDREHDKQPTRRGYSSGSWPVRLISSRLMAANQPLSSATFGPHFHACAFVMGPDEERDMMEPFFAEGMARGQKATYIVDPRRREETEARLRAAAPSNDLVEVTSWNDAHLKGDCFDHVRMKKTLDDMISAHSATGRPPMRLAGQMDWIFSNPPGIEQLVEYEVTVNDVLSRAKTPTVCVYDARRLNGGMLIELLRAHPLTVVNGVLHENPFYTPADEMLHELRRRQTSS
jgi:MEDS: MEthanogen/methylotroph, DcmR Sensory domain